MFEFWMIWIAFYLAHFDSLMFFFCPESLLLLDLFFFNVCAVCSWWAGVPEIILRVHASRRRRRRRHQTECTQDSLHLTVTDMSFGYLKFSFNYGAHDESWVDRSTVERDMCAQCILVGVYTTELKLWIDSTWPEIHIEEKLRHSVRPAQSSEHFDYFSRVVALSMKLVRKRKITIIQNSLTHRRFAELKQNLLNQLIMQF